MSDDRIQELERRIAALEQENKRLKRGPFRPSRQQIVQVPPELQSIFDAAQHTAHEYFQQMVADPSRGTVEIGGQRYVLVRASALSMDFTDAVTQLYSDRGPREAEAISKGLLFDIAHTLGISDARNFHQAMGLDEPVARLSAGPVHFAYSGWAQVSIWPESNPVPDQSYALVYDHPNSFEAASWLQAGRKAESPVCVMSAGYSSGWCQESFGLELTAVEVCCQARGDQTCTFVMAPPSRIVQHVRERFGSTIADREAVGLYVPTYFDRKRSEEAVRAQAEELQRAYRELEAAHQELQQTQEKHIQAGRLASIGELAAGVAHEINSPLQVIQGYANLLVEEMEALPESQREELVAYIKRLSKISAASGRCKLIVDDLLSLSRQSTGLMKTVPLADVVEASFDLIDTNISHGQIRVDTQIPEELVVWGNASQLQQVVTNIAMNSVQAMEQSPRPGQNKLWIRGWHEQGWAALEFGDTGPGIPSSHLDKLFDPFFTTKPTGQGTGLGLAIAYGIVKKHNGRITVDSSSKGTVFQVLLPVDAPVDAESTPEPDRA